MIRICVCASACVWIEYTLLHFHKWQMRCHTIASLMHITADGDNDEYSNWKEYDSLFSEAYQLKIFRVDALFTLSAELFMSRGTSFAESCKNLRTFQTEIY